MVKNEKLRAGLNYSGLAGHGKKKEKPRELLKDGGYRLNYKISLLRDTFHFLRCSTGTTKGREAKVFLF